jgi:hypothetical protein
MALWGLEFMTPSAWAKRFPRRSPSAAGGYQPPMSDIAPAKAALQELNKAVARANAAWNRTQLVDALRSVRYWTEQAEKAAKIVAENA